VETWRGTEEGTVQALPDSNVAAVVFHVLLGARNSAYVLAGGENYAGLFRSEAGKPYEKILMTIRPDPKTAAVEGGKTLWVVDRDLKPGVYRLEKATWTPVNLPDETALRAALGTPTVKEPLKLVATSVAVQQGKVYIGATIVKGKDFVYGMALLATGPGVISKKAGGDAGVGAAVPRSPVR